MLRCTSVGQIRSLFIILVVLSVISSLPSALTTGRGTAHLSLAGISKSGDVSKMEYGKTVLHSAFASSQSLDGDPKLMEGAAGVLIISCPNALGLSLSLRVYSKELSLSRFQLVHCNIRFVVCSSILYPGLAIEGKMSFFLELVAC